MEMLQQGRKVLAQLKQGAFVQALEAAAEFARDSTAETSSGALKTLQVQVGQRLTPLQLALRDSNAMRSTTSHLCYL
jgi:hypothetical protein